MLDVSDNKGASFTAIQVNSLPVDRWWRTLFYGYTFGDDIGCYVIHHGGRMRAGSGRENKNPSL